MANWAAPTLKNSRAVRQWLRDMRRDFRFFPIASGAALFLAIAWSIADKQRHGYSKLKYILQIILRFFLAYTITQYGAAKILDIQFSPSVGICPPRWRT